MQLQIAISQYFFLNTYFQASEEHNQYQSNNDCITFKNAVDVGYIDIPLLLLCKLSFIILRIKTA